MAKDMVAETTVQPDTPPTDAKMAEDTAADAATSTEEPQETPKAEDTPMETTDSKPEEEKKKDTTILGKYNWDDTKKKSKQKAVFTPLSGAIVDYAWCDGDKAVSIYVDLDGLDDVADDDMKATLINDNKGVSFKAKNVLGKLRHLKIDKLQNKVKKVKLVRKKGKNRVIIKIFKEEEKKWWDLKDKGSSDYDAGYDGDEWDDELDAEEDDIDDAPAFDDDFINETELGKDETMDEDKKTEDEKPAEEDKKDEDVPMDDAV